jgi:hypothetical protein
MLKTTGILAAAAVAAALVAPSPSTAAPLSPVQSETRSDATHVVAVQYRGRGWNGGYGRRGWGRGGAFVGGLAAGAIIGGALASRPYGYGPGYYDDGTVYGYAPRYEVAPAYGYSDGDAYARCAPRFRSFDASTGTYTTYGGEQRRCPYL